MANIFSFPDFNISPNPADHPLGRLPLLGIEPLEVPPGEQAVIGMYGTAMVFPLRIKSTNAPGEPWLLPVEPIISAAAGIVMARRTVAKAGELKGTIKERWSTDDWSISIEGLLTSTDGTYPVADVQRLQAILEGRDTIDVICPLFETLGIRRIAVESFNIPFTKGAENQVYQIQAFSDADWELFIPLKK